MDLTKVLRYLVFYIEVFDARRYPVKLCPRGFFDYFVKSWRMYLKNVIVEYDPSLQREIDAFLRFYRQKIKEYYDKRVFTGLIMAAVLFISICIFLLAWFLFTSFILKNAVFQIASGLIIIGITIEYLVTREAVKAGKHVAPSIDNELKTFVQKLIYYARDFIKENNLNPREFQIKLRHDDYEGLTYNERNGEYLAYISSCERG